MDMAKKTVIIGGVAGGATTATRLRRQDETMEIVMLERGEYISYANCGLPYYIGDVIKSRNALLVQTVEAMKSRYRIDVRVGNEVVEILPKEQKVKVKELRTGKIYEESYDDLVLATGSSPIKPSIPGIDGENIFTLWTVPDTDSIRGFIEKHQAKRAVVVGGGFIGLEMAENLHHAGLQVSIVEMQNQVMAPIDFEIAKVLHKTLKKNQVDLILGDGVKEFHHEDGKTSIELSSGRRMEADLVILSIGVKPNSALANQAELSLNQRGGVVVDSYLRTSDEHIYAVGDVIEVEHFVSKEKTMIPLAGPANKQARILANTLTGTPTEYKGTMGTSVVKVFDLDVASVGLNEKQLKAMGKEKGKDYETVLIVQKSHAGYYPGASSLILKMMFTKEGKILGGQIIGKDGVDKRIDSLATVMRLNGTVFDLTELELAYAPPFSSAKDPINMLGYVAENMLNGLVSFMEWDELEQMMQEKREDLIVLDVTENHERKEFAVEGSLHIPFGEIRERMGELDKDKIIAIYCAIGVRAYNVARILSQNGFKHPKVLSGGVTFYKAMDREQ